MKGTLHKTEDGWFVKHDGKTTPIEPNQNWWLGEQSGKQGFYKDGDEVDFEVIPYIPKDLEPTRGETLSFEAIKYARIAQLDIGKVHSGYFWKDAILYDDYLKSKGTI